MVKSSGNTKYDIDRTVTATHHKTEMLIFMMVTLIQMSSIPNFDLNNSLGTISGEKI